MILKYKVLKSILKKQKKTYKMNIEQRFLQKAIEDKNFVSFSYEGKNYKKVKPFGISTEKLKCDAREFDINKVKKIVVLKEKF